MNMQFSIWFWCYYQLIRTENSLWTGICVASPIYHVTWPAKARHQRSPIVNIQLPHAANATAAACICSLFASACCFLTLQLLMSTLNRPTSACSHNSLPRIQNIHSALALTYMDMTRTLNKSTLCGEGGTADVTSVTSCSGCCFPHPSLHPRLSIPPPPRAPRHASLSLIASSARGH